MTKLSRRSALLGGGLFVAGVGVGLGGNRVGDHTSDRLRWQFETTNWIVSSPTIYTESVYL